MSGAVQVALPEAWRVEAMRTPALATRWREQLAQVSGALLDWEDVLGSELVVAALDLSTAELLLKRPAGSRVVVLDHLLEPMREPGWGVRDFLRRARAERVTWVMPHHRPASAPWDLLGYLAPALGAGGGAG